MSSTEKRIEVARLLSVLRNENETTGDVLLRGLRALSEIEDVAQVRDEWCAEYVKLRSALQFIVDGYANQNINHVDYRVNAYQVALEALSSQSDKTP